MWYSSKSKPNSIIILDTAHISDISGCQAIEFRSDGKIGMFRAIDSILGYEEIKDGKYIMSFFDIFAKNRTESIQELEAEKHNDELEKLKSLLIELGISLQK